MSESWEERGIRLFGADDWHDACLITPNGTPLQCVGSHEEMAAQITKRPGDAALEELLADGWIRVWPDDVDDGNFLYIQMRVEPTSAQLAVIKDMVERRDEEGLNEAMLDIAGRSTSVSYPSARQVLAIINEAFNPSYEGGFACYDCAFSGTDREHVLELFLRAATKVWGEKSVETYIRPRTTLLPATPGTWTGGVIKNPKALAAVVSNRSQQAIGDHLLRVAPSYGLLVSDELLALDDAAIERTLIHEAVHLGYWQHGQAFREVCVKHGGAVSELGVEAGNTVKVQRKDGSRYKTVKEFDNERDAIAWAKVEMRTVPGKYRLEM